MLIVDLVVMATDGGFTMSHHQQQDLTVCAQVSMRYSQTSLTLSSCVSSWVYLSVDYRQRGYDRLRVHLPQSVHADLAVVTAQSSCPHSWSESASSLSTSASSSTMSALCYTYVISSCAAQHPP